MHLIPAVKKITRTGGAFQVHPHTPIALPDYSLAGCAVTLRKYIQRFTGLTLPIISVNGLPPENSLALELTKDAGERYRITIDKDVVSLGGGTQAALFRAISTFSQITANHRTSLPCLEIEDWPDFEVRGVYHDITRGKVPTLATLKQLVDTLAFYKINQLQLYVEHTFAFKSVPELWFDKDPIEPDEILELDAYCVRNHIDLVPSMATFGHLYELLRVKRLEHLNELDVKASEVPYNLYDRMAHYTLDPGNPESFALIQTMIDEFAVLFSSRYFNICGDETFDLGKGKSSPRAAKEGLGRVYVDFVKKVMGAVMKHRKVPMLWGDIVLQHPELISELPSEAIFLNWAYDPDVTESATATFARAGVRQYVCPGTIGWSRFANDIPSASVNIRKMTGFGKKYGAPGVLTTDWGDCAHVNFLANSYHGMILGAALSWSCDSFTEDNDYDRAVSFLQWKDHSGALGALLRELGGLCFYHLGNLYSWVVDKQDYWNAEQKVKDTPFDYFGHGFTRATLIRTALFTLRSGVSEKALRQDFDEFLWSAAALRWLCAALAFKKAAEYAQPGAVLPLSKREIVAEGYGLADRFKRLWRERNKESELRTVLWIFGASLAKIGTFPEP